MTERPPVDPPHPFDVALRGLGEAMARDRREAERSPVDPEHHADGWPGSCPTCSAAFGGHPPVDPDGIVAYLASIVESGASLTTDDVQAVADMLGRPPVDPLREALRAFGERLAAEGYGWEAIITREGPTGEETVAHLITANPDPAALASPAAPEEKHEHHWVDGHDDEAAWHCPSPVEEGHTHPTRETPGYERADVLTGFAENCPACRPPVDPLRWYAEGDAVCAGVEGDEHVIGLAASQKEAEDIASQHNAALASPAAPPEGLDEVQASLPDGWSLMVGYTTECSFCTGWWATASKRPESPADYSKIVTSESDRPRGKHHDATSAEAIRALLSRLSATGADR